MAESMNSACGSGTECCMECPHLSPDVCKVAAEHLRRGISDWVDAPSSQRVRYCGRFDQDKRCIRCQLRVAMAQRVREMREGVQLQLPWGA